MKAAVKTMSDKPQIEYRDWPWQPVTEEAVRAIIQDGIEMRESLRLLNRRLHAVRAALLRGSADEWILWRNMPAQRGPEDVSRFPTFAQAFDASLGLLIERSGGSESTVTSAADVARKMGSEDGS